MAYLERYIVYVVLNNNNNNNIHLVWEGNDFLYIFITY